MYEAMSIIFGLLLILFVVKYRQVKALISEIDDALEDDKLTAAEARQLIKMIVSLVK